MVIKSVKLYLNYLSVLVVSFCWSATYWLGESSRWQVDRMLSYGLYRPWIYRALVPSIARFLSGLGFRSDYVLISIVMLSCLGFYIALRKLYYHIYVQTDNTEIYLLVSVFLGLLVCNYDRLPYDLMTAFLMTSGIYLILSHRFWWYLVVLALASLNKETAFLLIIFFVVMSYRERGIVWMTACQLYIYGLITYCIRLAFSYAPGSGLWINPWENIVAHFQSPALLVLTLLGLVWLGFRIHNKWWVSSDLRKLFWVFVPFMLVAYIVCGQAYEFRSLWEIVPVLVLLI